MDQRRTTGAQGEQIAAAHLEGLGWTVIDRNWRSGRLGELDVVAPSSRVRDASAPSCSAR